MNFKLVKPLLRKNLLWMGSIIFASIFIVLILVLSLPLEKNNKIIYSTLLSCNYLFVYFIFLILNSSKSSVSIFTEIHSEMDLENKTGNINVKTSKYVHYFVIIIALITFLIQITSGGVLIFKTNFWSFFKNSWWIFFIVMITNLVFYYIFFGINTYLLDNSNEFKQEYVKNYFEHKEHHEKLNQNQIDKKIDSE